MRRFFSREGQAALDRLLRMKALLAFDFDGVLAPLVDRPSDARMRPYTAALLRAVARRSPVAVISGRSLSDVTYRLAGAPVVAVVGNHGAEAPGRRPAERVRRWRLALESVVQDIAGAWVEDKRYSLSIHYRGARDRKAVEAAILEEAELLTGARIHLGQLVINVSPAGAPDKGGTLRALARRFRCRGAMFVSDEGADGGAYRAATLGIRVGRRRAARAAFYLGQQREVDRLLEAVLDRLLQHAGSSLHPE